MYPIPGHLSVSLVLKKYCRLELVPVVVAGLFPDIVDKFLADIVHVADYGRNYMHSIPGLVVCTLAVYAVKGKIWGLSWALGHFGHLIGDLKFVPWFFPFVSYDTPPNVNVYDIKAVVTTLFDWYGLILEAALLSIALLLYSKIVKNRLLETALAAAFIGVLILRI